MLCVYENGNQMWGDAGTEKMLRGLTKGLLSSWPVSALTGTNAQIRRKVPAVL